MSREASLLTPKQTLELVAAMLGVTFNRIEPRGFGWEGYIVDHTTRRRRHVEVRVNESRSAYIRYVDQDNNTSTHYGLDLSDPNADASATRKSIQEFLREPVAKPEEVAADKQVRAEVAEMIRKVRHAEDQKQFDRTSRTIDRLLQTHSPKEVEQIIIDMVKTPAEWEALKQKANAEWEAKKHRDAAQAGTVKPPSPPQPSILEEAAAIMVDRQQRYGPPQPSHDHTAEMWSAYLKHPITAKDVCMMNILQKVSREAFRHTRDNLVDIAGYAANAAVLDQ